MMTDTALATPAGRRIPAPTPLLPYDEQEATTAGSPLALWEGWQGDIRFFLTAYLAGFVFFLAVLS